MFGAVLDTALGLMFVYLILSLFCTAINEFIATLVSRRSSFLVAGLRNLLEESEGTAVTDKVLANPLIKRMGVRTKTRRLTSGLRSWLGMGEPRVGKAKPPSYIPSRTFVLGLVQELCPEVLDMERSSGSEDATTALKQRIDQIPPSAAGEGLKKILKTYASSARGNVDEFMGELETWFDQTMERVSGWYKRYTQLVLVGLAVLTAGVLNVDTIQVASSLWRNKDVRDSVAAAATRAVESDSGKSGSTSSVVCEGDAPPDNQESDAEAADEDIEKLTQDAAACLEDLDALQLPMGWTGENTPGNLWPGLPLKILGLLLTAAALTLGAPFWFDTLSRVVRIRGSGPRPGDDPPPANERER